MKFLIVGRTVSGKDYLREILENSYGWKFVKSRTTRKPRYDGEDKYIFISKDDVKNTPESNIIAKTEINNEIYFATKDDFEPADAYIIDPNGVEYLCEKCKDEWFEIIYVQSDKKEMDKHAKERAKASPDPEKEFETYKRRYDSEDDQFTTFEAYLENSSFRKENCYGIHVIKNDYLHETMENAAIALEMRRRFYANMKDVIKALKSENSFLEYDDRHVHMFQKSTNEKIIIRDELLIQTLAEESKESLFADLMETYLFRPTPDHPTAKD